jgi:hypothetical protein
MVHKINDMPTGTVGLRLTGELTRDAGLPTEELELRTTRLDS